ncbi:Maf family protein [Porticoccus sp. W117]|uniref:Maf family protein n=1 Tax=Porticoccus sp. W117 TaxID=3054777 RepID=UPI0025946486|nr:Maf family protein [Porticoccus sp. W117]MDM3871732.1 Maf family protein [Porticoccus sp. W117]
MNGADFILASGSPRRSQLLQQIGAAFAVAPANVPEQVLADEMPRDYVTRLALAKAQAGFDAQRESRLPVLGSDTAVVHGGRILGKPRDQQDAVDTLMSLSNSCHQVLSGIAMVDGQHSVTRYVETSVHFRTLNKQQCQRYWETGEPMDKAGSYGIQGLAAVFVERIEGSYSNVVGLPLAETADLLAEFGIEVWRDVQR